VSEGADSFGHVRVRAKLLDGVLLTMSKKRPSLLRRARYLVEYALLRLLGVAAGLMPERLAIAFGVWLGGLLRWLRPTKRKRAERNLRKAYGDELDEAAVKAVAKGSFIHFALTVVETVWARHRIDGDEIQRRFPLRSVDPIRAELATGRGALVCGMHVGNWELMGLSNVARLGGMTALARPPKNPMIGRYMGYVRQRMGLDILSTKDGARPIVRALKKGRPVFILIDQHVRNAATPATFFGRPASTSTVVASLARRLDLPVFLSYSVRDGHTFHHQAHMDGPIELVRTEDGASDVRENTQRLNDLMEVVVRRHPEQWCWAHRRWKLAKRQEREAAKAEGR
jgi:Kdo2-lipid IVA lauroyltransferase/acyltransferase